MSSTNKLFFLLLSFLMIKPVLADDAVEALSPTNLMFDTTNELIMVDETLTVTKISKSYNDQQFMIDVDFHFKNISDKDITRKMAFALPPVVCNEETNTTWGGLDDDNPDDKSLKDFTVTVDGKPVNFTKRIEAMKGNTVVSAELEKLNLPLNPCKLRSDSNGNYPAQYADALKKNNLLENNSPAWHENIYFEWEQTFPANQIINIHHRYTPVVGASVTALRTIKEINSPYNETIATNYLWSRNLTTLAETNPAIISTSEGEQRFCLYPSWILYNLTTGAQWKGGIGVFKLIVKDESGAPFGVNEFYTAADAVQTFMTKTTMTITINDFIPKSNLLILFLTIPTEQSDIKMCGI